MADSPASDSNKGTTLSFTVPLLDAFMRRITPRGVDGVENITRFAREIDRCWMAAPQIRPWASKCASGTGMPARAQRSEQTGFQVRWASCLVVSRPSRLSRRCRTGACAEAAKRTRDNRSMLRAELREQRSSRRRMRAQVLDRADAACEHRIRRTTPLCQRTSTHRSESPKPRSRGEPIYLRPTW